MSSNNVLVELRKCKKMIENESNNNLEYLKIINDLPPRNVRKRYDDIWAYFIARENMNREFLTELKDSIQILENCNDTLQKFKEIVNKKKVGTLEGITRQQIREEHITMPESEALTSVLEQPYNEEKSIKQPLGGKRNSSKKNKTGATTRRQRRPKRKYSAKR